MPAAARAHQACITHQASDPLASVPLPSCPEFGMHPGRSIRVARGGVHGPDAFQQRRISLRVGRSGRRSQAQKPARGTPSTRAMTLTEKVAWFALMNRKTRTAPRRFRAQTRPPLEKGCHAPRGVACSRGAAGPAHRVHPGQGQARPLSPVDPRCHPLAPPSCGLPGRWLELTNKVRRIAARANQIDHMTTELRGIRKAGFRHNDTFRESVRGVHQSGGTSIPVGANHI